MSHTPTRLTSTPVVAAATGSLASDVDSASAKPCNDLREERVSGAMCGKGATEEKRTCVRFSVEHFSHPDTPVPTLDTMFSHAATTTFAGNNDYCDSYDDESGEDTPCSGDEYFSTVLDGLGLATFDSNKKAVRPECRHPVALKKKPTSAFVTPMGPSLKRGRDGANLSLQCPGAPLPNRQAEDDQWTNLSGSEASEAVRAVCNRKLNLGLNCDTAAFPSMAAEPMPFITSQDVESIVNGPSANKRRVVLYDDNDNDNDENNGSKLTRGPSIPPHDEFFPAHHFVNAQGTVEADTSGRVQLTERGNSSSGWTVGNVVQTQLFRNVRVASLQALLGPCPVITVDTFTSPAEVHRMCHDAGVAINKRLTSQLRLSAQKRPAVLKRDWSKVERKFDDFGVEKEVQAQSRNYQLVHHIVARHWHGKASSLAATSTVDMYAALMQTCEPDTKSQSTEMSAETTARLARESEERSSARMQVDRLQRQVMHAILTLPLATALNAESAYLLEIQDLLPEMYVNKIDTALAREEVFEAAVLSLPQALVQEYRRDMTIDPMRSRHSSSLLRIMFYLTHRRLSCNGPFPLEMRTATPEVVFIQREMVLVGGSLTTLWAFLDSVCHKVKVALLHNLTLALASSRLSDGSTVGETPREELHHLMALEMHRVKLSRFNIAPIGIPETYAFHRRVGTCLSKMGFGPDGVDPYVNVHCYVKSMVNEIGQAYMRRCNEFLVNDVDKEIVASIVTRVFPASFF